MEDLRSAFDKISSERVEGLIMSQDGLFFASRNDIAALALAHRLPMITYSRETVQAGGLAAYGPSVVALFHRAGTYVYKILNGARPSDIPVEQPTKFEFIINLATAKALGLALPQPILQRADDKSVAKRKPTSRASVVHRRSPTAYRSRCRARTFSGVLPFLSYGHDLGYSAGVNQNAAGDDPRHR